MRPERAQRTRGLVTERIDARASSKRMSHQGMQALHTIGHSSSADARDLWHRLEPFPIIQVLRMGATVRMSKIMIMAQPLVHLGHQTLRL